MAPVPGLHGQERTVRDGRDETSMMKEPTDHLTSEQLLAYRDGELLDFNFEMHVMSCKKCMAKLEKLNRLQALVGDALKGSTRGRDAYVEKKAISKEDYLPGYKKKHDDSRPRVMFSRRSSRSHESFKEDPILERAKKLIRRPQRKQSIGEFLSTDLENRPAAIEQGDARVEITGFEKPDRSDVCITIRDRYTEQPLPGIDITLFPETSGFENKPTDENGRVCFSVPAGRNRLIIHTELPLETVLVNIPE